MSTRFNSKSLVFILPVLLTACAGGSFDTDIVADHGTSSIPQGNKETPKDDKTESANPNADAGNEAVVENHLGYQLAIPRRNIATYKEDGSRTELINSVTVNEHGGLTEKAKVLSGAEKHLLLDKGNVQSRTGRDFTLSQDAQRQGFKHISLGFENFNSGAQDELQGKEYEWHVVRSGPTGNIFYQGEHAAKAIPTNPKVSYKGIWHYVTDAKQGRSGLNLGSRQDTGDKYGAISDYEDVKRPDGLASEFEVDFNSKKLTGKLTKTSRVGQKTDTRYAIDATIKNNRFSGNATATNKDDLYFHSDSNAVEGGFYGDKAQELAGSFMANDSTAFVVFGAKSNDELTVEQKVDAFKINIDESEDFAKSDIESFHDISRLVIDGKEIPLAQARTEKTVTLDSGDTVEVKATKLDYTVFGYFNHKDTHGRYDKLKAEQDKKEQAKLAREQARKQEEEEHMGYIREGEYSTVEELQELVDNRIISRQAIQTLINEGVLAEDYSEKLNFSDDNDENDDVIVSPNIKPDNELFYTPFGKSLFVQGQRTPAGQMPDSLVVSYQGHWQGSFASKGIAPLNLDANNKAEFTVNFGDKSLKGKLSRDVNEYIDIDAKITGSAFSGTAKTGDYGIYLDKANTLMGNKTVKFSQAKVEGGFYGPNASELGGGVYSHEPKAAVVFGAKKVESSK